MEIPSLLEPNQSPTNPLLTSIDPTESTSQVIALQNSAISRNAKNRHLDGNSPSTCTKPEPITSQILSLPRLESKLDSKEHLAENTSFNINTDESIILQKKNNKTITESSEHGCNNILSCDANIDNTSLHAKNHKSSRKTVVMWI